MEIQYLHRLQLATRLDGYSPDEIKQMTPMLTECARNNTQWRTSIDEDEKMFVSENSNYQVTRCVGCGMRTCDGKCHGVQMVYGLLNGSLDGLLNGVPESTPSTTTQQRQKCEICERQIPIGYFCQHVCKICQNAACFQDDEQYCQNMICDKCNDGNCDGFCICQFCKKVECFGICPGKLLFMFKQDDEPVEPATYGAGKQEWRGGMTHNFGNTKIALLFLVFILYIFFYVKFQKNKGKLAIISFYFLTLSLMVFIFM